MDDTENKLMEKLSLIDVVLTPPRTNYLLNVNTFAESEEVVVSVDKIHCNNSPLWTL